MSKIIINITLSFFLSSDIFLLYKVVITIYKTMILAQKNTTHSSPVNGVYLIYVKMIAYCMSGLKLIVSLTYVEVADRDFHDLIFEY